MKLPAPNRIAVYVGIAASVLGALAPVIADLDLSSTAGVVAGVIGVVTVLRKFLDGWQSYEKAIYTGELARQDAETQAALISSATKPPAGGLNLPR